LGEKHNSRPKISRRLKYPRRGCDKKKLRVNFDTSKGGDNPWAEAGHKWKVREGNRGKKTSPFKQSGKDRNSDNLN